MNTQLCKSFLATFISVACIAEAGTVSLGPNEVRDAVYDSTRNVVYVLTEGSLTDFIRIVDVETETVKGSIALPAARWDSLDIRHDSNELLAVGQLIAFKRDLVTESSLHWQIDGFYGGRVVYLNDGTTIIGRDERAPLPFVHFDPATGTVTNLNFYTGIPGVLNRTINHSKVLLSYEASPTSMVFMTIDGTLSPQILGTTDGYHLYGSISPDGSLIACNTKLMDTSLNKVTDIPYGGVQLDFIPGGALLFVEVGDPGKLQKLSTTDGSVVAETELPHAISFAWLVPMDDKKVGVLVGAGRNSLIITDVPSGMPTPTPPPTTTISPTTPPPTATPVPTTIPPTTIPPSPTCTPVPGQLIHETRNVPKTVTVGSEVSLNFTSWSTCGASACCAATPPEFAFPEGRLEILGETTSTLRLVPLMTGRTNIWLRYPGRSYPDLPFTRLTVVPDGATVQEVILDKAKATNDHDTNQDGAVDSADVRAVTP